MSKDDDYLEFKKYKIGSGGEIQLKLNEMYDEEEKLVSDYKIKFKVCDSSEDMSGGAYSYIILQPAVSNYE